MEACKILCTLLFLLSSAYTYCTAGLVSDTKKVVSVTFLVTVNDTWYPQEYNTTCLQTVKTPPLRPDMSVNETQSIHVGNCDHGPLTYTIGNEYFTGDSGQKMAHTYVYLTFYSSVILDASHPACKILWDYKYREPKTVNPKESLLPGCWLADSREGYHMTYYWFHILDWELV